MPVRNRRDGIIIIQDATSPTPNEVEIAHEEGNLQWTEKRNLVTVRDRGAIDDVREGDEDPCELSFSSNHVALCSDVSDSDDETPTLREICHALAAAADWLSTSDDDVAKSFRIIFWVLNPNTDELDEKIVFEKVLWTSLQFQEAAEANTLAFSAMDNELKPTITREAYAA